MRKGIVLAVIGSLAFVLVWANRSHYQDGSVSTAQIAILLDRPMAPTTLSEQKTCSDQAEKSFKASSFSDYKSSLGDTYTCHYDPASLTCFVEITSRHMDGRVFQYSNLIYGAFDGQVYGSFRSFTDRRNPIECSIKPRVHFEVICKSGDEFNELALLYFGTIPAP